MFNEKWEDSYFPDPGTVDTAHCGICGQIMDVERACEGATSYVMSIGGSKRKYDRFMCVNRGLGWHNQLIDLKHESEETSSVKIFDMLIEEASLILEKREPSLLRYDVKMSEEVKRMNDLLNGLLVTEAY